MTRPTAAPWRRILLTALFAVLPLGADGTVSLSYETLDFANSRQKNEGERFGITTRFHHQDHTFLLGAERTDTETKQPPLTEDLQVDKWFAAYAFRLTDDLTLRASYLHIEDNIAPTDDGYITGVGLRYRLGEHVNLAADGYHSRYRIMDVYQGDLSVRFGAEFGALHTDLTLIGKYIEPRGCTTGWCRNAEPDYFTPGFKFHAGYRGYHGGFGAFFGRRVFGVMAEGTKVQHHAMEFDRTWMVGAGKKFGPLDAVLKFTYLRAEELPLNQRNVKVRNTALTLSYHY